MLHLLSLVVDGGLAGVIAAAGFVVASVFDASVSFCCC